MSHTAIHSIDRQAHPSAGEISADLRGQVLAVPGDSPLEGGLAEVVPQVAAVSDLDRIRGAAGAAV